MPLVAHNALPTYERLRREGQILLSAERAKTQDIRALHVGLLNIMPDAAIGATERQFFRLLGASNAIAQIRVHPFTLSKMPRSQGAQQHIDQYYEPIAQIQEEGLDALIITGANPALDKSLYWQELVDFIEWAEANVTSTLCSCLATHAVLEARYGVHRQPLGFKRWGVYSHEVTNRRHPLVSDINTRFDVPHSRFNGISAEQFAGVGLEVLVEGEVPGVHLAVSPDGFRTVYFQGHPEYDQISLLKEYKREVLTYASGSREEYPPFPDNYFDATTQAILGEYQERVLGSDNVAETLASFPDALLTPRLHNTWHDSGLAIIGNWLGLVYQLTHSDRRKPFMDGVNPDAPLSLAD